jgi:hypothetical protein
MAFRQQSAIIAPGELPDVKRGVSDSNDGVCASHCKGWHENHPKM